MERDDIQECFEKLGIPNNHTSVGLCNLIASSSQYKSLFVNRRLPDTGLTDVQIQLLLYTLSSLDTNNAAQSRRCGVGEREGRVFSSLVANRHFGFTHGVGRSGDITEPQPKAVGSSAMAKLTLHMAMDAIRRGSGLDKRTSCKTGILLPLCTGMTVALALQSLKEIKIRKLINGELKDPNIVLWCRIDQKSCFKAISSAGMECVVIPTIRREGTDEVITDLEALRSAIQSLGPERIVAVITTTSCFAPRVPDPVDEVAKICEEHDINHLINNAYGLQCEITCKLINRACCIGRVDAIVSSTDKNFLVPIGKLHVTPKSRHKHFVPDKLISIPKGGALLISPDEAVTSAVSKMYAGRANASPCIDLFITLLSMGLDGYKSLLEDRKRLLSSFKERFANIAKEHGERALICPTNTISFGITLNSLSLEGHTGNVELSEEERIKRDSLEVSYFGSMLFTRCVSGTRVVPQHLTKTINNETFLGFGSSTNDYGESYLTAACALGLTQGEADEFFARLDKAFIDFRKKRDKINNMH